MGNVRFKSNGNDPRHGYADWNCGLGSRHSEASGRHYDQDLIRLQRENTELRSLALDLLLQIQDLRDSRRTLCDQSIRQSMRA